MVQYSAMKKLIPLVIFLSILRLHSFAQITLTGTIANPQPGDTAVYYKGIVDPGPSGVAVTWDFGSLDTDARHVVTYYACQNGYSICADSSIGVFLWHYYLNYNGDSLADMGWDCNCYETFHYLDPKQLLHYPLEYGGPHYTDSFQFMQYSQGGYYHNGIGAVDISSDAYGTLILPDSTYANTLRVKRSEVCKHTYGYNNGPPIIHTDVDEYYEWYSDSGRTFLLQLKKHISTTSVLDAEDVMSFAISPNPADDILTIDAGKHANDVREVILQDVIGRIVIRYAFDKATKKCRLDVSTVPEGNYLLYIQTGKGIFVRKVTIGK